jgi:hypothetical protein
MALSPRSLGSVFRVFAVLALSFFFFHCHHSCPHACLERLLWWVLLSLFRPLLKSRFYPVTRTAVITPNASLDNHTHLFWL